MVARPRLCPLERAAVAPPAAGSEADGSHRDLADSSQKDGVCGSCDASEPTGTLPRAPQLVWSAGGLGTGVAPHLGLSSHISALGGQDGHTAGRCHHQEGIHEDIGGRAVPGDALPRTVPQPFPETRVTTSQSLQRSFLAALSPDRVLGGRWCVTLPQATLAAPWEGRPLAVPLLLCSSLRQHKGHPHKFPSVSLPLPRFP